MESICQSCGMPLKEDKFLSSNVDGSVNTTYCIYCYKEGEFIDGCTTLQEKMNSCIIIATNKGMPKQKAEYLAKSILPNLNRWKK